MGRHKSSSSITVCLRHVIIGSASNGKKANVRVVGRDARDNHNQSPLKVKDKDSKFQSKNRLFSTHGKAHYLRVRLPRAAGFGQSTAGRGGADLRPPFYDVANCAAGRVPSHTGYPLVEGRISVRLVQVSSLLRPVFMLNKASCNRQA